MVSADPSADNKQPEFNTLYLFDCIRSALDHVLNHDREGLNHIVRGVKPKKYRFSASWAGRPSVFLQRYDSQPKTTGDFARATIRGLARIMARWESPDGKVPENHLGSNLRSSDDFAVYFNDALSLWVYAKKGIEADQEYANPNSNHLVFPHQVKVELVDFFETSHRRLLELSWGNFLPFHQPYLCARKRIR